MSNETLCQNHITHAVYIFFRKFINKIYKAATDFFHRRS